MNPVSKFRITIIGLLLFFVFLCAYSCWTKQVLRRHPFRVKVAVTFLRKIADTVPALAKAMIWHLKIFLLFYEIFKIQFGDYHCEVLDVQISFGN